MVFLHLEHLWNIKRWYLATNAMPLIKGLCIHRFPKLNEMENERRELFQAYMKFYFIIAKVNIQKKNPKSYITLLIHFFYK